MKVLLAVMLSWTGLSIAADKYEIRLDWNDPRTLEDSVVQMCDDTYYSAVEITIPGKPRTDYSVEMAVDITSGKVSPGCTVKRTDRAGSTVYTFNADSSCEVKVYQLKVRPGEKRKVATYAIHDAC